MYIHTYACIYLSQCRNIQESLAIVSRILDRTNPISEQYLTEQKYGNQFNIARLDLTVKYTYWVDIPPINEYLYTFTHTYIYMYL